MGALFRDAISRVPGWRSDQRRITARVAGAAEVEEAARVQVGEVDGVQGDGVGVVEVRAVVEVGAFRADEGEVGW